MIVFNTDAMLRLFSETSKSFRQILKNFSEKPVTALPSALQQARNGLWGNIQFRECKHLLP